MIALVALIAWTMAASPVYARWGMGGGDTLRIAFTRAKENAAHVTLRLNLAALPTNLPSDVRDWLVINKDALAADIAATPHEWETVRPDQASCALTAFDAAAPLYLSYDKCRTGMDLAGGDAHTAIPSFDAVGQMLVHESVHHLHGVDEAFADAVAIAVYDAWRRGADDWMVSADMPEPKLLHGAVAAGDSVIVFGGYKDSSDAQPTNTAFVFDTKNKVWAGALPSSGAPRRAQPILIYTGRKLIVWGGYTGGFGAVSSWQNSGAIYDFVSQTWAMIAAPTGPAEFPPDTRATVFPYQSAVWTGVEMIVYGGAREGKNFPGGIFNPEKPVSEQWRVLPATDAPAGMGEALHTAVWADDCMVVFGGQTARSGNLTNVTGVFNPATNKWQTGSAVDVPAAREYHTAVWTGSKMVVFGGYESNSVAASIGSGGVFDPKTLKWTYEFRSEAVQGRYGHTAVWSGGEMLIFGGHLARTALKTLNAVAAFNPGSTSWRVVDVQNPPAKRVYHSAVWTGSYMLITGGLLDGGAVTPGGALFFP